jgi:hypothetical protein
LRDLIQQVWHTDPLRSQVCQNIMRVIALIDQPAVVEKVLQHMGLWTRPTAKSKARSPPTAHERWTYEPCTDVAPTLDYENVLTE